MYDQTFSTFANNQIRHHATHKVDCQHGHFSVSQGFMWICMNLTYSLYPPPPPPPPPPLHSKPQQNPSKCCKNSKTPLSCVHVLFKRIHSLYVCTMAPINPSLQC